MEVVRAESVSCSSPRNRSEIQHPSPTIRELIDRLKRHRDSLNIQVIQDILKVSET